MREQDITEYVIQDIGCAVYDSAPGGSEEAVVFVHGNPGPMDDWEVLAPAIAKLGRVIAMDMPGFGRADRPRRFEYTVNAYASYLGALLDKLGVRRAHLVLHDFGGPWGLRWALDNPEKLASLTLINTGVMEGYKWHKFARIWQTPILGELFQLATNEKALRVAMNRDNPKPLPREFTHRIASFSDWPHKRAVLRLYRNSRNPQKAFPDRAKLKAVTDLPVCVIWGEGDKYLSVVWAERQKQYFPSASVHIISDAGHWPFIDDPDAVLEPLRGFLKQHLGR